MSENHAEIALEEAQFSKIYIVPEGHHDVRHYEWCH
jgi:hypothetical protein